jgi:Glycosyl transferase family group 2
MLAFQREAPLSLSVESPGRLRERLWIALPLMLSLFLASSIFWAPYYAPWAFAIGITVFFGYWVVRSYAVVIACFRGRHMLKVWERTNWQAKYCEFLPAHPDAPAWDWPMHMVIIPNYKEAEEGLARTLESLAVQPNARQLVVVMAMEEREPDAHRKARSLVDRFGVRFGEMFPTFHPAGLPNETPGKGSNEAWAAREAYAHLIAVEKYELDRFTITSCDADAVFHPRHFEALNYLFLTAPDRYRTFWQPAIFNSNNIWDIPAPLRIPDGLSGVNRMSNLVMWGSVRFPTSCYSLSWSMLHEVDYWDEEVIPEDWHLFMKCSYTLGDRVKCKGLFLPMGNDCVLTDGWFKTLRAHYAQSVRHAWGASDIPYAWRSTLNRRSPLGLRRKLTLAGAVTKVHSFWMAQWYLVTLGVFLPSVLGAHFGAPLPTWWTQRYSFPGPGWHPEHIVHPSRWFLFNNDGLVEPVMYVNIPGMMVATCIVPLIAMVIFEYKSRGPRPAYVSKRSAAAGFLMWPLMGVITFFFASMPALHAQLKLASGKGLIYRVAEKGSRTVPVTAAASRESELGTFPVAGGGQ